MDRLAEDHRRLTRLMALLEGLLDRFCAGDEPDYELMCELMEYMIDYADQVHHPSEDQVLTRTRCITRVRT
jgi:hemerythrin-like domain-containing protein